MEKLTPEEYKRLKDQFSSEQRSGDGLFVLLCRIFVCGTGVFFIGYGIFDYIKHGHYLSALIFTISLGLLLICLGIFTSTKICEKIADGIINGL